MKCIFCKHSSEDSRSVEHIIPESLGNKEHILPRGVVCDGCNNYFAQAIEKPLLETSYFREQCYRARIQTKKGRPPRVLGVHLQSRAPVELWPEPDGSGFGIGAARQSDEAAWIRSLQLSSKGTLLIPFATAPDQRLVSRFLAKVALEALALRLLDVPGGLEEVTDKPELDALRQYARRGSEKIWPYHQRVIYAADHLFGVGDEAPYEVLHEWTFLYTDAKELYLVLSLFGVEYAINLGGPEVEPYHEWLTNRVGRSPLL
jgi:hypothetical protein